MGCAEPREVLLYEIGVREAWRRQGVGRLLQAELEAWMAANAVSTAWVLADGDGAEEFYAACGFAAAEPQPRFMLRASG